MYELWMFIDNPGNDVDFKERTSNALQDTNKKLSSSKLCGAFRSEFGNSKSTVVIWQHESFDQTKSLRKEWSIQGG